MQQTTNQESIVFEIVQEYLNENHVFNLDKILPYIVSRFGKSSINISTKGIIDNLERLAEKNMFVEGSKLTKNEVLLNEKRKLLFAFIKNSPGVYFNQIIKKLNFSNHVIIWNVQILLKFNFIKIHVIDNREDYFESSEDLTNIEPLHLSSHEKAKKILNYLKVNDIGVTKTKIAKELNMHLNTVTKYLDSLVEVNIIYKENIGNSELYFLIEDKIGENPEVLTTKDTRKLLKE